MRRRGVGGRGDGGGAGARSASEGWLLRLRDCDERFLYAVCELSLLPEGLAAAASEAMAPLGWEAVLHGRKLYMLPAGLTKLRCVEYLVERLGVSGFAARRATRCSTPSCSPRPTARGARVTPSSSRGTLCPTACGSRTASTSTRPRRSRVRRSSS